MGEEGQLKFISLIIIWGTEPCSFVKKHYTSKYKYKYARVYHGRPYETFTILQLFAIPLAAFS
jgi:hypothetical protein